MTAVLSSLFINAIELSGKERLLLMWPLCLAVAVVYKATRCHDLRSVPKASLALWGTIAFGMYAVGIGLWALFNLLA